MLLKSTCLLAKIITLKKYTQKYSDNYKYAPEI